MEPIIWLGGGAIAGYFIFKQAVEPGPDDLVELIVPPTKFMYQDPKVSYAKLSTGMEFNNIKQKDRDQLGIPSEYWELPNGTSVKLYGANSAQLRRMPAILDPNNKERSVDAKVELDRNRRNTPWMQEIASGRRTFVGQNI
jgi:hypothetical protein